MTKKQTSQKTDPKIAALESSLARALADYANLERRFAADSAGVIKFATSELLRKILEIRDHLEMATSTIKDQSLTLILGSLDKLLEGEGVVRVKTDGNFDPLSMECQEMAPGPKDQVVQVVRPGYLLHDRVLRTARVVVGNGQINKQNIQGETI